MREDRIGKLKALLEQDPNDGFSRYALALEYAGANDSGQAVVLLEDLLLRDQTYVPAYQQLGYLYERLGRLQEAAAIFKRGMHIAAQQGDHHAKAEMQDALDSMEP
ncbi:MAG: tetratricopeptide repeat protein [Ignavibacteriales bacterium]|nr:tetratricopeptide repeat protein [Ignavibacteriales bacterium]